MDKKDQKKILETYLTDIRDIHFSGAAVKETSYYGPLANLLNGVGKSLNPKIFCFINLKNRGAGIPDGGLFTKDQLPKHILDAPPPELLPARGAIEVKGTAEEVGDIAKSEQVKKYLQKYRQVLVTNLRDFILVALDEHGTTINLESYSLAADEREFWKNVNNPVTMANEHTDRFTEYLVRVILHAAPLVDPEELARFLASYAREAQARIKEREQLPGLVLLRDALENALGLKFEGEDGEHFFRATLVQTLFYGIFSSWVLWAREQPKGSKSHFDWHQAAWTLHVPMIASLFEQIATPTRLKPLAIDEVLDWTGMVLNRISRERFFERFEEEHAVQYFYEPFLKAYDPELRKELGVWYTPPEIVKYQVARVDTVLREELDIPDGLADPNVYVLDPCCGTGAYLVEVIHKIHDTLKEKGGDALVAQRLKKAATERVFGFEILPAPFVVSHLQLGLLLKNLGAPLSDDKNERAGVYLTNALTGWEPPKDPKTQIPLPFPELQDEKDAAEKVKSVTPIIVIIGNPPYNAFAGTSPEEEGGLIEPYKEGLRSEWKILAGSMHDLYIRFFRIAERRIAKSGKGIVCFISNFSYLADPSFVVMRKRLLDEFDKLWIDCMNGDSRETGKLTPEGQPDPSVFSLEQSKVGIRVGTAVSLMVRKEKRLKKPHIRFRHFWGITKRKDILESLDKKNFNKQYNIAKPERVNRFSFRPSNVLKHYLKWPLLTDFSAKLPYNGLMEKRGGALIDIDRDALENRIRVYFDSKVDWDTYKHKGLGLERNRSEIDPKRVRARALKGEHFDASMLVKYVIRPFDVLWAYYSLTPGIWNRSRPLYHEQCWMGNKFLMTRPAGVANPEGTPFFYTTLLGDNDFQRGHAYYFPFMLKKKNNNNNSNGTISLPGFEQNTVKEKIKTNLSAKSIEYLNSISVGASVKDAETAGLIWMHALAIGYSPAYLEENADGIRQDWPRIPLPDSKEALLESAELGKQVAALLDTESGVSGVTEGKPRVEMRAMGLVKSADDKPLNPDAGDLDLTAGWGHGGKDGVCMPGKGQLKTRDYLASELNDIKAGAESLGLSLEQALDLLGRQTRDVYLNGKAYWMNVPANVWEYYIGGYQVIKKWLSYREKSLLGRSMKMEEVEYVTEMVRRIAAIILLQPALNENYTKVKESTYNWPEKHE